MRIIAKKTLREFWEQPQYGDTEQPLKAWFKVASAADYGNASILANNRVGGVLESLANSLLGGFVDRAHNHTRSSLPGA